MFGHKRVELGIVHVCRKTQRVNLRLQVVIANIIGTRASNCQSANGRYSTSAAAPNGG